MHWSDYWMLPWCRWVTAWQSDYWGMFDGAVFVNPVGNWLAARRCALNRSQESVDLKLLKICSVFKVTCTNKWHDILTIIRWVTSNVTKAKNLLMASQSLNGWPSSERLLYPVDLKLLTAAQRSLVSCALVFRKSSDLLRLMRRQIFSASALACSFTVPH